MQAGRILLATLLLLILVTNPVLATDFEFTANGGASGNWNQDDNWDDGFGGGGTPDINDTATIPNGKTCIVPAAYTAAAANVTVEAGGTITVTATLEVGENAGGGNLDIDLERPDGTTDTVVKLGFSITPKPQTRCGGNAGILSA